MDAIVTDFDPKYSDIIKMNFPEALHQLCVGHFNNIIDSNLRKAAGLKYSKKKELPDDFKELKGKIHYVFSSKNRLIAEKRIYSLFQVEYGKNIELLSQITIIIEGLNRWMGLITIRIVRLLSGISIKLRKGHMWVQAHVAGQDMNGEMMIG